LVLQNTTYYFNIVYKFKKLFVFRKLSLRLGGLEAITFYQQSESQNFNFCYINNQKNYIINNVNKLFQNKLKETEVTMFSNNEIYVIHKKNQICGQTKSQSANIDPSIQVSDYLKNTYPKQKFLPLFFQVLTSHNLINTNMFIVGFPNLHIADLCSFLNNKFGKTNTTDIQYIKFCKYLQSCQLKFPKVSIKNPVAQKYLC